MNPKIELLSFGIRVMMISNLLSFLFPVSFAVDPDCNYYQNMDAGVTYYVYNREYPNNYRGGQTCRWIAIAPQGYQVKAQCQIEMPQSQACSQDRLLISLTGNPNLENAHTYCGSGNVSHQTSGNNISIGLVTASNTRGGRFLCTLNAVLVEQPGCDCGWRNTRRIVGGTETKINEFPMMAGVVDFEIRDLICGATIIATRYATTAAHCLRNKQPRNLGLLVGEHNVTSGTETGATRLLVIAQFTIHPRYDVNDVNALNDIAVVRTEQIIEYNQQVGPACLPFRYVDDSFAGDVVEALGWGTTEFTGPRSDVLLKTDLDVITPAQCNQSVGGNGNLQMCTYRAGHDACQSDSGGPLLYMADNLRVQLVGIISGGYGCASNKPGLNTRVTAYLTWIMSVTPDAQYCVK